MNSFLALFGLDWLYKFVFSYCACIKAGAVFCKRAITSALLYRLLATKLYGFVFGCLF
jgi:hypothetical protein